jgi:MraZ protein
VFVGEFERAIDGNGRVVLPANFRDKLGGEIFLRLDPRGSLTITTPEQYEQEAATLHAKVGAGEAPLEALEALGASTSLISIDKHGRITLDDKALAHSNIRPGRNVMFVGTVYGFAMWRPSRYATIAAERDEVVPTRIWENEDDDDENDDE